MDMLVETKPIVNGVGASWFEDLSEGFLDECLDLGVAAVGCTANDTWDDTLESMENLQSVKRIAEDHERAYVIETQSDLKAGIATGHVGVILGFQNPKPLSDTINFLEAFADMGLRCCGLAFRENSYYGCGFSSTNDSGDGSGRTVRASHYLQSLDGSRARRQGAEGPVGGRHEQLREASRS